MKQFADLKFKTLNILIPLRIFNLKILNNNGEFYVSFYGTNHNVEEGGRPITETIEIKITQEKLMEIISFATIVGGQIQKYMCFLEDTETGLIEPYFYDSREVKKALKDLILPVENLSIGDRVLTFTGQSFYEYYYFGTDITNNKYHVIKYIYANQDFNGPNHITVQRIIKPYNQLGIVSVLRNRLNREEIEYLRNR